MKHYIYTIVILVFLSSCEDTNILVMTDAATDAVKAFTLDDEDVKNLAQRAASVSDSKYQVARAGSPYESRLRRLISPYIKRDGNSFDFKVYLTDDVNAFAMADGTVRVYSGLMDLMSDEELLFVIGHEMGHVVKEHSRKQLVLAYASSALRKGLAAQENEIGQIARSVVGSFTQKLTSAQFSQHEERQADLYGADFLQAEGYDRAVAVSALQKLGALNSNHTFLSSHPEPEERAKRLMEDGDTAVEKAQSFFVTLIDYLEKLIVVLLNLVHFLVGWLLSLL